MFPRLLIKNTLTGNESVRIRLGQQPSVRQVCGERRPVQQRIDRGDEHPRYAVFGHENSGARERDSHANSPVCHDARKLRMKRNAKFLLEVAEELVIEPLETSGPGGFGHAEYQRQLA